MFAVLACQHAKRALFTATKPSTYSWIYIRCPSWIEASQPFAGANTAIFTVVNGVLLKPLPYPQPDRLAMLWERQLSDGTLGTVAPANFVDWREQNHSFDKMAAIDPYPDFILNGSGEPQRLTGAAVSSDFFSLLGVHMALGRDFLPEEDRPGHNQVAIVSYSTWLNYFGGRPDIVERQLTLNNTAYSVVC